MQSRAVAIVTSLVLALAVVACSLAARAAAPRRPSAGGPLVVRDAWVRAAPAGGTSAAYMSMTNGRARRTTLVGVERPGPRRQREPPRDDDRRRRR